MVRRLCFAPVSALGSPPDKHGELEQSRSDVYEVIPRSTDGDLCGNHMLPILGLRR